MLVAGSCNHPEPSYLSGYVVNQGMAGIFHYQALEEAAIHKDPAKRTTDLLRRVLGSQ